jgi:hypothetical protein
MLLALSVCFHFCLIYMLTPDAGAELSIPPSLSSTSNTPMPAGEVTQLLSCHWVKVLKALQRNKRAIKVVPSTSLPAPPEQDSSFVLAPTELILAILHWLDLQTLFILSQSCKRLWLVCAPRLYRSLHPRRIPRGAPRLAGHHVKVS